MCPRPVSGTKEWAASNENIQIGCSNGCLYCYAHAQARRFKRVTGKGWTDEVIQEAKLTRGFGKRKGTIMFPTTHDINPTNLDIAANHLRRMLEPGNRVLIVSKPRLECIRALCHMLQPYREQILFRFTIGSMDNGVLGFWEPGAPSFSERLYSLYHAFDSGFETSVSMEPLLIEHEGDVVRAVEKFATHVTDAIWIGKANKLIERMEANGFLNDVTRLKAEALMRSQVDARVLALYDRLKDHPHVKWKESIKKVVGIEVPTEAGLDE